MQKYNVAIGLRDMTLKSKKAVAYHEAGHGVAACLTHKRFKIISIVPDEEAFGKCITIPWKNFHPDYETGSRTILRTKTAIFISLAGPVAECEFTKTKKLSKSFDDFKIALEMAYYLCGSTEEAEAYLRFMWEQTKNIVTLDHNWKAIEVVANALLEEKALKYRKTLCLIQKASDGMIPPIDLL